MDSGQVDSGLGALRRGGRAQATWARVPAVAPVLAGASCCIDEMNSSSWAREKRLCPPGVRKQLMWPASVQRRIVARDTPRYSAAWELVNTRRRSLRVNAGERVGVMALASSESPPSLSAVQVCGRLGGFGCSVATSNGIPPGGHSLWHRPARPISDSLLSNRLRSAKYRSAGVFGARADNCKQTCTEPLKLDKPSHSGTILLEPTHVAAGLWMETNGMPLRETPSGAAKETIVVWKH